VQAHPGRTAIKFNITDTLQQHKITMRTMEKGFTMNDEMAFFLNNNKNIDVSVLTV
jgi:DNA polymerase-3 subunit alpha